MSFSLFGKQTKDEEVGLILDIGSASVAGALVLFTKKKQPRVLYVTRIPITVSDDIDEHNFTKSILVTNTKITIDGLAYSDCEGIEVLSWGLPLGGSIRDLVEKHKLYPVTQLSFLNLTQKQELLSKGVVLISQICKDPNILDQISIPDHMREEAMKHPRAVCNL